MRMLKIVIYRHDGEATALTAL